MRLFKHLRDCFIRASARSVADVFLLGDLSSGAPGRTRTDTWLPILDFESSASTSFTTEAKGRNYTTKLLKFTY